MAGENDDDDNGEEKDIENNKRLDDSANLLGHLLVTEHLTHDPILLGYETFSEEDRLSNEDRVSKEGGFSTQDRLSEEDGCSEKESPIVASSILCPSTKLSSRVNVIG